MILLVRDSIGRPCTTVSVPLDIWIALVVGSGYWATYFNNLGRSDLALWRQDNFFLLRARSCGGTALLLGFVSDTAL